MNQDASVPMRTVHVDMADDTQEDGLTLLQVLAPLASAWRWLVLGSLLIAVLAFGATYLVKPTFTAKNVFLPPQQQQSSVNSALASLGALSGLAGAAVGLKTPADQYVALMYSDSVSDKIVDRFKLTEVYDSKYRVDARKTLTGNVVIVAGKKDGLITVAVDDEDAQRAADMANQYVEELRLLTNRLALSEAQQRRSFFENQLQSTRDRLTQAQIALQDSGFTPGALRAEPKAAAEGYARLRAEVTSAEVRLATLRNSLTGDAPEVRQQQATLAALRGQLGRLEDSAQADRNAPLGQAPTSSDYIGKYREFKYQETLFDLFARQFEIARLDESREGALIQVVDTATRPEKKSRPRRALTAVIAGAAAFIALSLFFVFRHALARSRASSRASSDAR